MKLYKKISDNSFECYSIELNYNSSIQKDTLFELFETNVMNITSSENKYIFEVKSISKNTPWSSNVMKICKKSGLNEIIKDVSKSYVYIVDNIDAGIDIFNEKHDMMTETYKDVEINESYSDPVVDINDIEYLNKKYGLSLDAVDILNARKVVDGCKYPLFVLLDIAQSNSEHCRHHFFNGDIVSIHNSLDSSNKTLFELVKEPLRMTKSTASLVAFSDNSSVIRGYPCKSIDVDICSEMEYVVRDSVKHFVLTAETHNFPTGIAPFQGAATGIGGRIRDVQATGVGAVPICSSAGYCVGDLDGPTYEHSYPSNLAKPMEILIGASNGASDYGNKFGEPIILGFTRSFMITNDIGKRIEWVKPIMFTAGLGVIRGEHLKKSKPEKDMLICKIGGPAYRVGLGGSAASSRISDTKNNDLDFSAVQRDDAEMEQKMNRVVRACTELGSGNPIMSIHDQGAGGNGNVLKEIVDGYGAVIDIGKITLGDNSMNDIEVWLSEYQESNALLVKYKDLKLLERICKREDVQLDVVGRITGDGKLDIVNGDREIVTDYVIDTGSKRKRYYVNNNGDSNNSYCLSSNIFEKYADDIYGVLKKVFRLVDVGSKRFLTNKVDRSVTGLIAQQQCVGPFHTPLSNFGLVSSGFIKNEEGCFVGCATSVGEQPIVGLFSIETMVMKTIGEMLTNMMFVLIDDFENISCSANWMWPYPNMDENEGGDMYIAMEVLSRVCCELGIIIDGGKDSLSMAVRHDSSYGGLIKCPGSLVLSGYARCPDIYKKVTPDLKSCDSHLYFIDLSRGFMGLGGSCLSRATDNFWDDCSPYIESLKDLKAAFKIVQSLIEEDMILAGHDKSDGGLITTLVEMSISSGIGIDIDINHHNIVKFLFNEGLGFVLESKIDISEYFYEENIPVFKIGKTNNRSKVVITNFCIQVLQEYPEKLRELWESRSFDIEMKQCNPDCVKQEMNMLNKIIGPPTYTNCNKITPIKSSHYVVGIIREEGSNSDREIGTAFLLGGVKKVIDINSNDLIDNDKLLDGIDVIVFVGGFSFADVLGSGKGWETVIRNNKNIREQFDRFFKRSNTYSLGICNGCQLMIRLGWIGNGIKMRENISGRFESRFPTVMVNGKLCKFTEKLDEVKFGVWVANHEGRFDINDAKYSEMMKNNQIVMQYINDEEESTYDYPYNPNGSYKGVAAVCSKNGRHLAMMPHPERSFMKWQLPWCSYDINGNYTPWFKMFCL